MPFDHGLRLNRQRIPNAREKPIEADKNQSVDGAEGLFLRSGSPQNVYLLPQHSNFCLKRCPRPKQIDDHPNHEPDKISHPATASPDSRSTASQIEFAIGTTGRYVSGLKNLAKANYRRANFISFCIERELPLFRETSEKLKRVLLAHPEAAVQPQPKRCAPRRFVNANRRETRPSQ
jgi:hypothetical protein